MILFATIVGYLVIASVAIVAISAAFAGTVAIYTHLLSLRFDDAKRAAMIEMAGRLIQDSYWFGEDPPTAALLQALANDITTNGWSDVNRVREKWREQRDSASVNQIS